jgi:hypothetical protein
MYDALQDAAMTSILMERDHYYVGSQPPQPWVWTKWFREYLINLGQLNEINVVGPLLWYLWRRHQDKVKKNHDYIIVR